MISYISMSQVEDQSKIYKTFFCQNIYHNITYRACVVHFISLYCSRIEPDVHSSFT